MITIIGKKGAIRIHVGKVTEEIPKVIEWEECKEMLITKMKEIDTIRKPEEVFASIEKNLKNMQCFYYETKIGSLYMKSYMFSLADVLVH